MRFWALLLLGIATGLAAEPADSQRAATLVATANKDFISISERSIVVRLALTNTGQNPLAIVRWKLGTQIKFEYTPKLDDTSRKPMTWTRDTVPLSTESGEPSTLPASEYVIVAPGKEYGMEVDLGSSMRPFPREDLMPGVYLIDFWYSYEPNSAERSLPLIREVKASAPVRIMVGTNTPDSERLRARHLRPNDPI